MNQPVKKQSKDTILLQSPYPGLQALLPRLRSIGLNTSSKPLFDEPKEAQHFLDKLDRDKLFCVVPVWAIDHNDLESSSIVKWTFAPYMN
jgi:hypothetical protein